MKKILLLLFVLGCTHKTYNTPFIDANETIKLEFGMTKNAVLRKLNEPLYVSYGNKDTIIWVYEVRTIEVKSTMKNSIIIPTKNTDPYIKKRHTPPLHKLSLTFSGNSLSSWSSNDK
tara:strand:+ start:505 stop:855 length:351 start_codon:yes stop_codon:yes gene_type:complete